MSADVRTSSYAPSPSQPLTPEQSAELKAAAQALVDQHGLRKVERATKLLREREEREWDEIEGRH